MSLVNKTFTVAEFNKRLDDAFSAYREKFGADAPIPVPPFGWPSVRFLEKWDQAQVMLDCIERGEPWDDEADYSPWKGVFPEMARESEEGVVF